MAVTKKRGGGARVLAWLFALIAVLAAWQGLATVIRHSYSPDGAGAADPAHVETGAIILTALALMLAGMSEARVQADLVQERRVRKSGVAEAVARKAGGRITDMVAASAVARSRDVLDILAPFLSAVTALIAAGWVWETTWGHAAQIGASVVMGLAAGLAIIRRVAAASRGVAPSPLDVVRSVRALLASVVAGGIGAYGWTVTVAALGGRVEATTVVTAAVITGSVAAAVIGLGDMTRRVTALEAIRGQLGAVLGVPESALDDARVRVDRRGRWVRIAGPLPAAAVTHLADLDTRLAAYAPEWEVSSADPRTGVLLIPATAATTAARSLLADSDGMVTAVDGDVWMLAPTVSPAWGARVDAVARRQGRTLARWEPYDRRATVAALDALTLDVRERIAAVLKADPWDVAVTVEAAEPDADHPIRSVTITRMPAYAGDRTRLWRDLLIPLLPGGNPGWLVDDTPSEGRAVLTWAPRPVLPAMVPLADILPAALSPDQWATLPLGLGADGEPVAIDLAAGPHTLVVGPTGSGKTVALVTLVTEALARGHAVVMADPTKAGLDFAALRPWMTGWADDYSTARALMEQVYAEVGRRKGVLKREVAVKWSDLDPDVREREGIRPLLVLLDEYGSLALDATVPKGLDKADPLVIQAQELNAAKAVVKELVGRVAREARFVGIHLAIALQRPDVAVMGSGELRSNLTSAVQLVPPGRGVSGDALRMVFSGDVVESAAETIRVLDDGHSRGLGIVAAEGGTARGVRVAYAPMRDVPALLDRLGVPRVTDPWDLADAAEATTAPVEGQIIEQTDGETVTEPELDLTDFVLDPEPAPKPAPAPVDDWGW